MAGPTTRVTAEEWADYLSEFRTIGSEMRDGDDDLLLCKLPNGVVVGMVRYLPDRTKRYTIRPGLKEQYAEFVVKFGANTVWEGENNA